MKSRLSASFREDAALALNETARRAGRTIMDYFENGFVVEKKADASPVTRADQDAEQLILKALAKLAPDIPVIAEEEAAAGRLPAIGDVFFLVDALDGTREFINKRTEFTVNIGLIENNEPVLGVVYAPALDRLFYAFEAGRAYQQGGAGEAEAIHARPAPDAPVIIASRSHRDAQTQEFIDSFARAETLNAGSSLKFCLLACGEADIYPRFAPTSEWDTAAGHAVLRHAGGHMRRLDGAPFLYGKTGASYLNPGFMAWGRGEMPLKGV